MSAEYRIEYSIQARGNDEDDFTEIGFGSSGAWEDVDQAAHMLESDIATRSWETGADMPDPASIP